MKNKPQRLTEKQERFCRHYLDTDGNADISIDGVLCSDDLHFNEQLFTLGEVHFDSANVDTELDVNALYEVQSHGITYRGFLKEVSYKYAKAETAKYKLIVKEIEIAH